MKIIKPHFIEVRLRATFYSRKRLEPDQINIITGKRKLNHEYPIIMYIKNQLMRETTDIYLMKIILLRPWPHPLWQSTFQK